MTDAENFRKGLSYCVKLQWDDFYVCKSQQLSVNCTKAYHKFFSHVNLAIEIKKTRERGVRGGSITEITSFQNKWAQKLLHNN